MKEITVKEIDLIAEADTEELGKVVAIQFRSEDNNHYFFVLPTEDLKKSYLTDDKGNRVNLSFPEMHALLHKILEKTPGIHAAIVEEISVAFGDLLTELTHRRAKRRRIL